MSHILIVDDDPSVLMSLAMMLESRGCTVEKSNSGTAALEILKNQESNFDCIVLDYSMPKMNGLSTLQEIRALEIATPVIMCSGLSFDEEQAATHTHWPQEIIGKPFQLDHLMSTISKLCDEYSAPSGTSQN